MAVLARTTLIFFCLLILSRVLGKRQLNQLTFFNYVTGITIGSIAANIISVSNEPFIDEFIGLVWWCILVALIELLGTASGVLRKIINGQPNIIIKRGKIIKRSLWASRLNLDDISMMLREEGVFTITEVEYGILESDGKLSVLKKPPNQEITKEDINAPLQPCDYLPSEIIVNGYVIKKTLKEFNLDNNWLEKQLKKQKIKSPKEVLYAELQCDGTLYIQKDGD